MIFDVGISRSMAEGAVNAWKIFDESRIDV